MKFSPIQHIVKSAHLGRSNGVYVAALTIYLDDSGTSPTNSIAGAAGWIAKLPSWELFQRDWEKIKNIESDKFGCMHMAEFVHGSEEFEGWDLDKKLRVIRKLRKVIMKRALKGFALGVIKKDFDEVVPDELRKLGFENHYTFAVRSNGGNRRDFKTRRSNTFLIGKIGTICGERKSRKYSPGRKETTTPFVDMASERTILCSERKTAFILFKPPTSSHGRFIK